MDSAYWWSLAVEGLRSTGLPHLALQPSTRVDKDALPDKCCKLRFAEYLYKFQSKRLNICIYNLLWNRGPGCVDLGCEEFKE